MRSFGLEPRKIGAIEKFWAEPFFSTFSMFFWLFYHFFWFCLRGVALQLSGCSSVLLLFTNFPIYFRNSQNFHQFISNPPRFQCFIATMQVSSIWSSTFPKKVWNLFRLNLRKFETSVVLHEINWKLRLCIKYVGSFEIVKAVAFWLSGFWAAAGGFKSK